MGACHESYKVFLIETEQRQLEQVISARKSCQSEGKRANVVLKCAQYPNWTDA